MEAWTGLFDILLLLSAALVLGALAGTLRQSAIIGYLVAGMLVGPNVLGWVGRRGEVVFIAELGVTLLLFSIGLEFSLKRLIKIGPVTYLGGTAQVVLTTLAGLFQVEFKTQELLTTTMTICSFTSLLARKARSYGNDL